MKNEKLAEYLAKNDPRAKDVQTTAEARAILPSLYKYWFKVLKKYKEVK